MPLFSDTQGHFSFQIQNLQNFEATSTNSTIRTSCILPFHPIPACLFKPRSQSQPTNPQANKINSSPSKSPPPHKDPLSLTFFHTYITNNPIPSLHSTQKQHQNNLCVLPFHRRKVNKPKNNQPKNNKERTKGDLKKKACFVCSISAFVSL